jgi:hypothetical protein
MAWPRRSHDQTSSQASLTVEDGHHVRAWPEGTLLLVAYRTDWWSPSGQTKDAKCSGPPARYYVFCVAWLYHRSRTHLALCKDAPEPRAKQPPECGPVIEIAEVGGLHHRYERRAA